MPTARMWCGVERAIAPLFNPKPLMKWGEGFLSSLTATSTRFRRSLVGSVDVEAVLALGTIFPLCNS